MLLVTGGTGFIGNALVQSLLQKHKVRCLVRNASALSLQHKNLEIAVGSLTDPVIVGKAMQGVKVVVHLAAVLNPSSKDIYSVNVEGTKTLLEAAKRHKVKKFIFISTENVLYPCKDAYTQSKVKAESLVGNFKNHTILREPIVYGPGDTKYIGKLIAMLKKYPFIPIPGDGNYTVQPVYVGDLVYCIKKAVTTPIYGTYAAVGGNCLTYEAIVDTLMEVLRIKKMKVHIPLFVLQFLAVVAPFLFIKPPLTRLQLYNLSINRKHDITNLKKRFGYTPLTFAQGIKKMLKSEHL